MPDMMPEKKDRRIALVVVDVQRKFTGGSIPEGGSEREIGTINEAASMFRAAGRPVVFVRYDGPSECSPYDKDDGDEYLHGIVADPGDVIVHKAHMNSFLETGLADVVRGCGCDSVLLAGMVTQLCVMGTYFGAFEHEISPYLLAGGTIATEDRVNEAAYVLCKTFDMADVAENLRTARVRPDKGI